MSFFSPVPESSTRTGLISVKNSLSNITCLGPFKLCYHSDRLYPKQHSSAVACSYPEEEIRMDIPTYLQITKTGSSLAKPLYHERRLNEH